MYTSLQCTRLKLQNSIYCGQHTLNPNARIKHGLVTEPLKETDFNRTRLLKLLSARDTGFRWYSRDRLWDYADKRLGLDNVTDMSDEQYMDALRFINNHFSTHKSEVYRLRLTAGAGPQSLADRGAECEE